MASGPTLPPQAYTREILTAAFNWLQTQPESSRKLATTPDALVGLYMRAQRFGNSTLETDAPVSSQSFMSDLKNLAEGLKQFEEPRETRRHTSAATTAFATSSNTTSSTTVHPAAFFASSLMASGSVSSSSTSSTSGPPPNAAPQGFANHDMGRDHGRDLGRESIREPVREPLREPVRDSGRESHRERDAAQLAVSTLLNERSQAMIHEVKTQLNLSSDAEAVNMMLAIGYKNLRNLLS